MKSNDNNTRQKRLLVSVGILSVVMVGIIIMIWWLLFTEDDTGIQTGENALVSMEDTGQSATWESTDTKDDLQTESGETPEIESSAAESETTENGTSAAESSERETEEQTAEKESAEPSESEPPAEETTPEPSKPAEPQAPAVTPSEEEREQESEPTPMEKPDEIASGDITCDDFALYTGQFVEDGRDELVENVAAILVTNHSNKFLDLATLTYDVDGRTATFVVTGLPAKHSAWVMEANRMVAKADSVFTYIESVSSFRDDVIAMTDKVPVYVDGNMLIAVNNTQETMEDIFVYYKCIHADGNYLGGITYRTDFGTLKPGESKEVLAGHFDAESAEIVRIGWRSG